MATHDVQAPKNLMALAPKHKVFLSHAGAQKGFVEQLNLDLKQRDRHAFFDLDRECLPKGDKFPPLIFKAIRQCEVGVVILSKEFLTRKWPMLELVAMVKKKARGDGITIMPIFYKVSVNDLKDKKNLSKWKIEWKKFVKLDKHGRISILEWEGALQKLEPINGLVFNPKNGKVNFRKEIVDAICTKVPPYLSWDDSHVQGKSRFIEIVEKTKKSHLENGMKKSPPSSSNVLRMGLYGVGGIGKTTTCKFLCKHFEMEFCGRVCHVEIGKGTKVDNLHTILKKLTNAELEHLRGLTEDQCYARLRNIGKVFLAIDNVSSNSEVIKEVKKYLAVEFECGSTVLITARSPDQLKGLVDVEYCFSMPEIEKFEAMDLIRFHAEVKDEVEENILEKCIKICLFGKGDGSSHYVPLVLEVVGRHLSGSDPKTWVEKLQKNNGDLFDPLREEDHPIFTSLRISYDALKPYDKDLFMDVAIFHSEYLFDISGDTHAYFGLKSQPHWNVYKWLRVLHGDHGDVKKRLDILKTKSLLEEIDDFGRIGMHDLWKEFAIYETKASERKSRRWVCEHNYKIVGEEDEPKESILVDGGWETLERICIQRDLSFDDHPIELFNFSKCSNVMALRLNCVYGRDEIMEYFNIWSEFKMPEAFDSNLQKKFNKFSNFRKMSGPAANLSKMKNLKILEVHGTNLQKLSGLKELRIFIWFNIDVESLDIFEEISLLKSFEILQLEFAQNQSPPDAKYSHCPFKHLQILHLEFVENCSPPGSKYSQYSLFDIGDLKSLLVVRIKGGCFITKLCLSSTIRVLDISYCTGLTNILGLEILVALQTLCVMGSKLLALPDMSNWTLAHLVKLELNDITFQLPNLSHFPLLTKLYLHGIDEDNQPIQNDFALHCHDDHMQLKKLKIARCPVIQLPDLSKFSSLEELSLIECHLLTSMICTKPLTTLNMLDLYECWNLKVLSGVSHMRGLETLSIFRCNLEELPDFGSHMRLKFLEISFCEALRSWDGVGGSKLQDPNTNVELHCNWTLAHLVNLRLYRSPIQPPDLSHFPQLTKLSLSGGEDQSNISGYALQCHTEHMHLKVLTMMDYPITELPDLSKFPSLEDLQVINCQKLTSLTSRKTLAAMQALTLENCENLKQLLPICYMPGLRNIWVSGCGVTLTEDDMKKLPLGCVVRDWWNL